MSYTQFGYSSYTASSPLVLGGSTGQSSCYERTSPELYPRLPAYGPSYQTEAPPTEPFYAPAALNPTYAMKEGSDPWRSISQSASYYYDPTLAAYGYGGLDFNGARRKNVTRDSTSTLKAWLNEHRKNPYPTKGEKIMLAIITKMTLTQVSTWFANARRRLKKENKMTWEPRNKAEAHDEESTKRDEDDGKDDETFDEEDSKPLRTSSSSLGLPPQDTDLDPIQQHHRSSGGGEASTTTFHHPHHHQTPQLQHHHHFEDTSSSHLLSAYTPSSHSSSPDASYPRPASSSFDHLYKPKIWSLADTATGGTPPQLWAKYGQLQPQSSCAAASASFGRYGGGGFGGLLQTDTPPQTPPNMKVAVHSVPSAASAQAATSASYIEAYMGQQAAGMCQQDSQLQDDKLDAFPSNHGSVLPQSSSSNQNTASDCISEDFDDPSQYSTSSVR